MEDNLDYVCYKISSIFKGDLRKDTKNCRLWVKETGELLNPNLKILIKFRSGLVLYVTILSYVGGA